MNEIETFRAAMAAAGLRYDGPIITDERLHRFKAGGDNKPNSWYVLHAGPPAAGAFGCWKRGIKQTWCERTGSMTRAEAQKPQEAHQHLERQLAAAEERARCKAASILKRSQPASSNHPYLSRKKVHPYGELREWCGRLVIPMRDSQGVLCSLQFIAPSGDKRFLRGGRVKACWFTIPPRILEPELFVCEGLATGLTLHKASGAEVWCAMSAGNLLPVCEAARDKYPDREIVVCADNDRQTPGNPGLTKAREAALAIKALLAVPQFTDHETGSDFNDLHVAAGIKEVMCQLEHAAVPRETPDEACERLAKLTPLEYDRVRKQEANKLKIRLSVLDQGVKARRPKASADNPQLQGRQLQLPEPEPWPEPVDGAQTLAEISATFERHVVMPKCAADVVALWVAHAHCFEAFEHTPRLILMSATRRCGKTLVRDIASFLVPRPLPTENISTAALFRIIESSKPTLLVDEFDGWLRENSELISILNSGHKRGGQVARCVGDDSDVRAFRVFAPVLIAGIGSLPPTLADRSIVIRLQRASEEEIRGKARFDSRKPEHVQVLARKLARWVSDNRHKLGSIDPKLPGGCFNREADVWRPLFAIAEAAGGDWPERSAEAFNVLTDRADDASLGEQLLHDIWQVFQITQADRIKSADLAASLCELEGRPWAEWHGRPLSPNSLAKLLKPFGIIPGSIRLSNNETAKGYPLEAFEDAFKRYISFPRPDSGGSKRHNVTSLDRVGDRPLFETSHVTACDGCKNATSANTDAGCDVVTFPNPKKGGKEKEHPQTNPQTVHKMDTVAAKYKRDLFCSV